MNIILFGAPGAGKGTQSKLLTQDLGLYQLSTGDLVRAEIASGSETGQEIEKAVKVGKFPTDETIIGLMKACYESENLHESGVIFDGFPRTVNQAKVLNEMLLEQHTKIHAVVVLDVDPELVKKRILGRFSCDQCGAIYNDSFKPLKEAGTCDECGGTQFTRRSDDTAEAIDNRLKTYKESTQPVIDFYTESHDIIHLDGSKDPHQVFLDLKEALGVSSAA